MTGKIKTLKAGYGFISQNAGTDVFFHRDQLVGVTFEELHLDDVVSFDLVEGPKGMHAVNVQRA